MTRFFPPIALLLFSGAHSASAPAAAPAVVIAVLSYEAGETTAPDSLARESERGLALGVAEANETMRLFGGSMSEKRLVLKPADGYAVAERALAAAPAASAILVTSPRLAPLAAQLAAARHLLFINTVPSSAAALPCSATMLRVYPPAEALALVSGRWASAQRTVADTVRTALWQGSLQRFGARELNDRYDARWRTGMTGPAWASWLAVKLLSEAALRTQSVRPLALRTHLLSAEFDGHKGWPLTFRKSDHVLRQPLYVVSTGSGGRVLAELPRGDPSGTSSAAAVLDGLQPPLISAQCPRDAQ